MVKVAFIGGGESESIFLKNLRIKEELKSLGIEIVKVLNARGENNLDASNISPLVEECRLYSPDVVIVLADVENDPCFTIAKRRIGEQPDKILLARKAFEAWLLADTAAMRKKFGAAYSYPNPENTPTLPWEEIKRVSKLHNKNPPSSKPAFTREMVDRHGFSLLSASKHPYCPSAKYFVDTVRSLSRK